jgi:hypothetical protein
LSDKLGATGDYPKGKLNADDEGGLMVKISTEGDTVRVDFGKPIAWIGYDPDGAIEFASKLIDHAMELKTRGARRLVNLGVPKP